MPERWRNRSNVKPASSSSGLRVLRPLVSGIGGSQQERLYLHFFRSKTGGSFSSSPYLASFWDNQVPRAAFHHDFMKHAVVALGSSYRRYHQQSPILSVAERNELDIFTTHQLGKSMHLLRKYIAGPGEKQVEVVLLCCVVFICTEMIRGQKAAAYSHFTSGAKIIDTLPDALFRHLGSLRVNDQGFRMQLLSRREMRLLLKLFENFEHSDTSSGFILASQPNLPVHPHRARDDVDETDHQHSHEACSSLVQRCVWHTFTRIYETRAHKGDVRFWSSPAQVKCHAALIDRVEDTNRMLNRFMSGPAAPRPETDLAGYVLSMTELIEARGSLIEAHSMPYNYTRSEMARFGPLFREMVEACEAVVGVLSANRSQMSLECSPWTDDTDRNETAWDVAPLTLGSALLIATHFVVFRASDIETRKRAARAIRHMGDLKGSHPGAKTYEWLDDLGAFTIFDTKFQDLSINKS
ncbi:hypothetical protein PG985_012239 [Apiospora marii]|uniref:uncharacterized protein n=1 Tax=Apiospora marii TaxID=335849 RepID=UPI003130D512